MIFFRVDSNKTIASGHVMRCISIAHAFKELGQDILFITADSCSDSMIESAGFSHKNLNSQWDNLETEINDVIQIINKEKNSLLIIDTYSITRKYVEELLPFIKICYLGSKQDYLGQLDALVNYSTSINYEFYKSNYTNTKLLLGIEYVPLRKEFQNIKNAANNNIKHILVSTGNTDSNRIIPKLLNKFTSSSELNNVIFDVIVGGMFINIDELDELEERNKNVKLHKNVNNMSELMQNSYIAVAANGTTVFELAACGVPPVTFAMVQEQVISAESLGKIGIVKYCGKIFDEEKATIDNIYNAVMNYCNDEEYREQESKKVKQFVDGNGCMRIAETLLNLERNI